MSFYYLVRQGDWLSKIAAAQGFSNWHTLYDHPSNAAFRRLRPNPNLIYPGDRLFIPDRNEGTLSAPAGQRTRFRTHRSTERLEVTLRDYRGEPLRNTACELTIDGATTSATTDATGKLERTLAPTVQDVRLTIAGITLILGVGQLNPMNDADDGGLSGVKGRLYNLGYYNGPIHSDGDGDGELGDATAEAIRAFQRDNALPETGEVSQPLKDKLTEKYGA